MAFEKIMDKEFMGTVQTTFLIYKNGIIRNIWDKVKVKGHVEDVLEPSRKSIINIY